MSFLWVGIGGFFGAITRYGFFLLIREFLPTAFPIATLIINCTGCFVAGALTFLIAKQVPLQENLQLVWSVGFLGAYTTFSAFGVETLSLLRTEQIFTACLNVLLHLVLGLAAVWYG